MYLVHMSDLDHFMQCKNNLTHSRRIQIYRIRILLHDSQMNQTFIEVPDFIGSRY